MRPTNPNTGYPYCNFQSSSIIEGPPYEYYGLLGEARYVSNEGSAYGWPYSTSLPILKGWLIDGRFFSWYDRTYESSLHAPKNADDCIAIARPSFFGESFTDGWPFPRPPQGFDSGWRPPVSDHHINLVEWDWSQDMFDIYKIINGTTEVFQFLGGEWCNLSLIHI